MARIENVAAVIHVRFGGRSFDLGLTDLDISSRSSDRQVKQTLARYLDVSESRFDDYVVDRHTNGNLTVRPEAVFG